jgi:predicted transcriptional regulator
MVEKHTNEKNNNDTHETDRLLAFTAQIATSYVGHHTVPAGELPALLATIHQGLARLSNGAAAPEARPEPSVPVRRSIMPEYIICLEDGKKLKMLKRHLKTAYNMTPEQYRERWNLPADYPMVAPNYAKQRSKLAKQIGLGTARSARKKG